MSRSAGHGLTSSGIPVRFVFPRTTPLSSRSSVSLATRSTPSSMVSRLTWRHTFSRPYTPQLSRFPTDLSLQPIASPPVSQLTYVWENQTTATRTRPRACSGPVMGAWQLRCPPAARKAQASRVFPTRSAPRAVGTLTFPPRRRATPHATRHKRAARHFQGVGRAHSSVANQRPGAHRTDLAQLRDVCSGNGNIVFGRDRHDGPRGSLERDVSPATGSKRRSVLASLPPLPRCAPAPPESHDLRCPARRRFRVQRRKRAVACGPSTVARANRAAVSRRRRAAGAIRGRVHTSERRDSRVSPQCTAHSAQLLVHRSSRCATRRRPGWGADDCTLPRRSVSWPRAPDVWYIEPTNAQVAEQLRAKIAAKIDVAKVLGTITTAVLALTAGQLLAQLLDPAKFEGTD